MRAIDALLADVTVDAPIHGVMVGAFWTAVVLEADPPRAGLASSLRPLAHTGRPAVADPGRLHEQSGRELAEGLQSASMLEAAIGMAALNALLEVDEAACRELNAERVIIERGRGPDKSVAIVGHFPFVDRVREAVERCSVLELTPRPGDIPAERADEILPQADVVALTGTSLINHTFDEMVGFCRPDAYVLLLGPSAPLSPVLFDFGVDAISGTRVADPTRVLPLVSQGANFRQIKREGGVRLLTMVKGS